MATVLTQHKGQIQVANQVTSIYTTDLISVSFDQLKVKIEYHLEWKVSQVPSLRVVRGEVSETEKEEVVAQYIYFPSYRTK